MNVIKDSGHGFARVLVLVSVAFYGLIAQADDWGGREKPVDPYFDRPLPKFVSNDEQMKQVLAKAKSCRYRTRDLGESPDMSRWLLRPRDPMGGKKMLDADVTQISDACGKGKDVSLCQATIDCELPTRNGGTITASIAIACGVGGDGCPLDPKECAYKRNTNMIPTFVQDDDGSGKTFDYHRDAASVGIH